MLNDQLFYQNIKTSPGIWLAYSYRMKKSADILWRRIKQHSQKVTAKKKFVTMIADYEIMETAPICMMLFGLSLEIISKAIYLKDHKKDVNLIEEKFLFSHGIFKFIKHISSGLLISKERKDLISRLEESVFWAGRYPIPKQLNKYKLKNMINSKRFNQYDKKIFESLYVEMENRLK